MSNEKVDELILYCCADR